MEQRQAVRFCPSSQKATELVSRKPQSTEAEAEDWLLIGNYIGILYFFWFIDYWLLMNGLFGFRWLPVWKSQRNPSKSVAHFKCETTAPRLRFPAIAAVPCPPKYISELRPVEPCWTLNPKPVALATYYPSGTLATNYGKSPFSMGKSTINHHFQ